MVRQWIEQAIHMMGAADIGRRKGGGMERTIGTIFDIRISSDCIHVHTIIAVINATIHILTRLLSVECI
jgi:hypothetical protein